MANILLACEYVLFRKGLRLLLDKEENIHIIGEVINIEGIENALLNSKPDLIVINFSKRADMIIDTCKKVHSKYQHIPILLFLDSSLEISIPTTIVNGVRGIIWKENTKDELIEAINKVAKGELFFENPDNCRLNCHLSEKIKQLHEPNKNKKNLSIRELEIIKLISDGLSYKEIATELFISHRTVETHKNNIIEKLELRNTNELIKYAIVNNI